MNILYLIPFIFLLGSCGKKESEPEQPSLAKVVRSNLYRSKFSHAISDGGVDTVKSLIDKEIDITFRDRKGFTPLQGVNMLIVQSGPNRERSIEKYMRSGVSREEAEKRYPETDMSGKDWGHESYNKWIKIRELLLKELGDSEKD